MAKVSQVPVPTPGKNFGVFKAEKFEIFDEEGLSAYSEFRNRAADPANGIRIENIREYSKKSVETSGETTTTTEEIILVVQYWEKPVKSRRGDSDEEADAKVDLGGTDAGPGVLVPARAQGRVGGR